MTQHQVVYAARQEGKTKYIPLSAIATQLRADAKVLRRWLTDPTLSREDMNDLANNLERQAERLEGKK